MIAAQEELKPLCLNMLYSTLPGNCNEKGCPLSTCAERNDELPDGSRQPRFCISHGNPMASVMFIGEAPGSAEKNSYIPLAGAAEVLTTRCVMCESFEFCYRTLI